MKCNALMVEISDFLENIIPTPKDHQAEPS